MRHYETAFSPEIQTDVRHCQVGIINIQSQRRQSGQVGSGGRGGGAERARQRRNPDELCRERERGRESLTLGWFIVADDSPLE